MSLPAWIAICIGLLLSGVSASQSLTDLAAILLVTTAVGVLWQQRLVGQQGRGPSDVLSLADFWREPALKFLVGLLSLWWLILGIGLWRAAEGAPKLSLFLEFRWMVELLLWLLLFSRLPLGDGNRWAWLLLGVLVSCAYGLATFAFGYTPLHDFEPVTRVGGFLNNPMPLAHVIGPLAVLVFGYLLQQPRPLKNRWLIGIALLLGVTTLLTFTRGVWAGVFVAALLLPLLSRVKRGWLVSLASAIGALVIAVSVPSIRDRFTQAFDPNRSYDGERVVLWQVNMEMFADSPWIGLGYSENGRRLPEYYQRMGIPEDQFQGHAHNQYLHLLAGTGVLGLVCYLVFIGFFLRISWLAARASDSLISGLALGLFGAQIVFHVAALTESNFSIAKNRYLILLLMALAFTLWRALGRRLPQQRS